MFTAIVITALLSSAVTLAAAWILYKTVLEKRLDRQLAEVQDEFERRVKAGVLAAGQELLPQLRKEVEGGFNDALRNSPVSAVEGGVKAAAESANLLGSLLGLKPRR